MRPVSILLILILLLSATAVAQHKGDWILSASFGMFSKGGLSVKYFPIDGVGVELCGGPAGMYFYNVGLWVDYYPDLDKYRTYFLAGYSLFGGFAHHRRSLPDSAYIINPDTDYVTSGHVTGISLGIGYESIFPKKENVRKSNETAFIAFGPTKLLHYKTFYRRIDGSSYSSTKPDSLKWAFFLEGGKGLYYPRKK